MWNIDHCAIIEQCCAVGHSNWNNPVTRFHTFLHNPAFNFFCPIPWMAAKIISGLLVTDTQTQSHRNQVDSFYMGVKFLESEFNKLPSLTLLARGLSKFISHVKTGASYLKKLFPRWRAASRSWSSLLEVRTFLPSSSRTPSRKCWTASATRWSSEIKRNSYHVCSHSR